MKKLKIEKWLLFWELYDRNAWYNYLFNPLIELEFKNRKDIFNSYLHDSILVPAIEELEANLKKIDDNTKFLYWFRFREELNIISEDLILPDKTNLDNVIKPIYKDYTKDWNNKPWGNNKIPSYAYFKWFYLKIYFLKGSAYTFLNDILFDLPVLDRIEKNKRNSEILKSEKKEQQISIYNYGSIDTIINANEKIDLPYSKNVKYDNIDIVENIISNFKNQIENKGLFKLLYEGKERKLRTEKTAQLLFFSIAQIFCLANDIDVSPEVNSGNGSVDFKFSKGSKNIVNVEIKYSSNPRLKHGLTNQLPEYDLAESSTCSYYLIIQVDNNDKKIEDIIELDRKLNPEFPKTKVVNGQYKKSASINN